jgi:hypothetical protein
MKQIHYLLIAIFLLLVSTISVQGAILDSLTTNYALDETSGTNVINLQAPYLNGTKTGSPTQNITGKLGKAYQGWSASNYIDVGFTTPTVNDFSFNIWVNWTNSSTNEMFIIGADSNALRSWGLYLYQKQIILSCVVSSCGGVAPKVVGGSGYALENYTRDNTPPNTWIMITGTYIANRTWTLYVNGVLIGNSTEAPTNNLPSAPNLNLGRRQYGGAEAPYNSGIDQFNYWTKLLNQTEITTLYNYGFGLTYPLTAGNITPYMNYILLLNQNPANITATTLYNTNVNITYQYVNESTTLNNYTLNYSLSNNIFNCLEYSNGTCVYTNNTFKTLQPSNNISAFNNTNVTYSLNENIIYPSIDNLNFSYFNNTNYNTLSGTNDFISIQLTNISNINTYNVFEIMANSTNNNKIYICNNSYNFASLVIHSINCQEIGAITTTTYNHTHSTTNKHNLIAFTIINNKISGTGITATPTMYFLYKGQSGSKANYYYANTTTTSITTRTTLNGGNNWNLETYTVNAHLHFYPIGSNINFNYQGRGYFNNTLNFSAITTEIIDFNILPPTPPIITNPFDTIQNTSYLNITYLSATPILNGTLMSYYNITLLNNDLTYNRTIILNNSLNNYYNWNVYNENLSLTSYYIKVCGFDSTNQNSCDIETFNLTRNALLNITSYDTTTNITIANFTINITNQNTSTIETYTSNNLSIIEVNIIKNNSYNIIFDNINYALTTRTYNTNASIQQFINQSMYKANSINVLFYDEATGNPISNVSCNLTLQGTSLTFYYGTTTGNIFISNLTADNYTAVGICTLYTQRQYFITVTERSTQTLYVFLLSNPTDVLFSYTDKDTGVVLENVLVGLSKVVNGSLTLVESRLTDVTGRTQFNVATNTLYQFVSTKTGYISKTFTLNPVIFTSYNVQLQKDTTTIPALDYSQVAVTILPNQYNFGNNNFIFTITSADGVLESYGYNLSNKCNSTTGNGVNLYGGTFTNNILLSGSCISSYDIVTLNYYYTTTDGTLRTFTRTYGITQNTNTTTISTTMNSGTYGMGLFERIIISTIITLILVGVVASIGGMVGGLFVGLLVLGFFVSTGFIPLSVVIITLFAGFVLVASFNKRG